MVSDRHCDWHGKCKRKPYAEVFPFKVNEHENWAPVMDGGWSYLCYWHFQYARVRNRFRQFIGMKVGLGWAPAETTEEYLKRLKEEMEDEEA